MVASRGRIGSAQVGLMTVTIEEAAVVSQAFALMRHCRARAIRRTPYIPRPISKSFTSGCQIRPILTSVQTAGDLIEDFVLRS